ncbi:MAG TPA: putative Ig domain-containing protein, partial [Fibrella sp.]
AFSLATAPAFADPENQALTYSASKLPKGLSIDVTSGIISGTPSKSGETTVTVTATDPGKLSVSTSFVLTVNEPVNTAPTVVSSVPSATVIVGQVYSLNVASVFTDAETPAQLNYSVSGLSKGINYNPKTNTISGSPNVAGVLAVVLTATDPGKLSTSTSFTLTLKAAGARIGSESHIVGQENTLKLQLEVYPNPVVGSSVSVQIRNAADQTVQLRLIDLRGKVVHEQQVQVLTNQHIERVELSNVPAGMLLLHVSTDSQSQAKTIIKQ